MSCMLFPQMWLHCSRTSFMLLVNFPSLLSMLAEKLSTSALPRSLALISSQPHLAILVWFDCPWLPFLFKMVYHRHYDSSMLIDLTTSLDSKLSRGPCPPTVILDSDSSFPPIPCCFITSTTARQWLMTSPPFSIVMTMLLMAIPLCSYIHFSPIAV